MSAPAYTPPPFDWFVSAPSLPRVEAVYDPNTVSSSSRLSYYSETFASSNLTLPEGSFLLLICAAFYNVTWSGASGGSTCTGAIQDEWPAKACLRWENVTTQHSGIYYCYQSQQSDPNLITSIQLNVIPKTTVGDSKIIKQSFDTVLTWSRRPIELVVEYEFASSCNNISTSNTSSSSCDGGVWILLPGTILDGRYDPRSKTITSSGQNATSFAYVSTTQLTATRYASRLVIPHACYQYSGLYRFQLDEQNITADFNITVQLSPWRIIDPDEGRDSAVFTARLLYGRVYEISCLKRPQDMSMGGVANVTTDFFHSVDPQFCTSSPNYARAPHNLPEGGFMKLLPTSPPMCGDPGRPNAAANSTGNSVHIVGSPFTLTAKRPGMVRCTFNWISMDSNGRMITNTSSTEFRYKVVDRPDLVRLDQDFVVERWPDTHPPIIGDPMTIRCVAPTCQYDKIVLEKESYKLVYSDEGIIRNDFNATASFDNTSVHMIVSLMYEKATRFSSGQYQCRGYDHDIPTGSSSSLAILLQQPRPPIFDLTESYTERVLLEDGKQVQLSCYVDGLPKPTLTWSFNDQPLTAAVGELRYENATLTIRKRGHYKCGAINKYGKIQRNFDVVDGNEDKNWMTTQILVATACAIAVLAAVCVTVWLIRRWRLASLQKLHTLMLKPAQETLPLEPFMPVNDQIECLPYDDRYEIGKAKFTLCSLLGSGEYGKVYRGVVKSAEGDKNVAIKVPRDSLNTDHHKSLISELKIMIYVRQHINVLSVLGACTTDLQSAGFYIITEYCDRGSLRDFLIANRDKPCSTCSQTGTPTTQRRDGSQYAKNITSYKDPRLDALKEDHKNGYVNVAEIHHCCYFTTEKLLSYGYQSASGMEYLAAKNVIHRDLALRNLLLHGEVVKIADFGLSRHYGHAYNSRRFDSPLPIFWMALESILSYKYSEKSDVWSFGVVMWELFSLGDLPYSGKKPDQQFVQWLRGGNRMSAPKLAPDKTYDLMLSCWKKHPDTRPTFSECKRTLGQHLDNYSSSAYRSLLLTLASAKAASDDLPLSKKTSSAAGDPVKGDFVNYVVVDSTNSSGKPNSPDRLIGSNVATSATSTTNSSDSGASFVESPSTETTTTEGNLSLYMAPCID